MNNIKTGVKLRVDSRDRHGHIRFGVATTFDPESNYGFDLYSTIEPSTEVSCTAYSTTKVRSSQSKLIYDLIDLWSKVNKNQFGADPRDTLGTAIKEGLKYLSDTQREFVLKGYYRADTGPLRPADNVRSSMSFNQSSAMMNSYWYQEWNDTPAGGVMPIGKTMVSAHSYVIVDWKIVNGVTMFLIDSHQGIRRYMPFQVFEDAISKTGCSVLMPSTQEVLDKRQKTILEAIRDALINVVLLLKQMLALKQPPSKPDYQVVKEQIMKPTIQQWASRIEHYEGANPKLRNPGNFKYSPLIASWGATKGPAGSDGGYFAQFATIEQGRQALINFLTLGCHDELKAYHKPPRNHPEVNPRTIKGFTLVYTNFPKPAYDYSDNLCKDLGLSPDTNIATFLV